MQLFLKLTIFICFLQYVTPSVNIPEIFQKPKKKIEIPAPKTLDIREATPEEFNCVGRPNGNHANLKDCMSFWACVENQTYFVVCPEFPTRPEFPGYQTYYNPVKRLCDKSDEFACLTEVQLDEDIGITSDKDETETETSPSSKDKNDSEENNSHENSNDSRESKENDKEEPDDESNEVKSGEDVKNDSDGESNEVKSGEEVDSDEEESKSNRLDDEL